MERDRQTYILEDSVHSEDEIESVVHKPSRYAVEGFSDLESDLADKGIEMAKPGTQHHK